MARNFPTARYLDEPTRFAGLTAVQWLSAGLALGAAYGLWWLIGFGGPLSLPLGGPWGLGVRVFLCALCAAGVFLVLTLLSGSGRREPYGRRYWSYLRRPHRYGPPTRPVTDQAPGTARSWSPRVKCRPYVYQSVSAIGYRACVGHRVPRAPGHPSVLLP